MNIFDRISAHNKNIPFFTGLVVYTTYSKHRRMKSRKSGLFVFKTTPRSFEDGRLFFPFELVKFLGTPFESKHTRKNNFISYQFDYCTQVQFNKTGRKFDAEVHWNNLRPDAWH